MTTHKVAIFHKDYYNDPNDFETEINKFISNRCIISIQAAPEYVLVHYKEL